MHPIHAVGRRPRVVLEKGHGIWLQDTEGKDYINLLSSIECTNLGHGRREIIDAVLEQMNKVEFHSGWYGLSDPTTIECAQKLAEITPVGLDHIIFTSGGAESTDVAFKMVYLYWFLRGKSHKSKIISLYGSYHGLGAGSWASNRAEVFSQERWGPSGKDFLHIPSYHCYRCMFGLKYPDCNVRCARYLEEVITNEKPETIAAFIGEPVIGGSGAVPPPPEYWPIIRQICDEHDVLLIADEVMTGFTRTGKMFAMEHWGIKPDIMTVAKAISGGYIPLGAVVISDKVYQILKGNELSHGYTFCGHPTACAAGLAAMNLYVTDKVAENAAKVGKHILERLEAEFKPLPCIDNPTGLGMMLGFDVVTDKTTKTPFPEDVRERIYSEILDKGIISAVIWGSGNSRFLMIPPCTMTIEEADLTLDILLPIIGAIKPS